MARRYAERTSVPVSKSQGDIISLAEKRGVTDFFSGQEKGRPFVAFVYRGYPVKLQCPAIPADHDDPEQEKRRQWRVMLLWAKAQFEAIDNGLLEPYAVFMPFLALKDGRTVAEAAKEDGIEHALADGFGLAVPALPEPEITNG